MKKTLTGLFATLVVAAIALISVPLEAQNFTNNTGGSYNATCNAVVRMNEAAAEFDGTAELGQATAIEGTVEWADADNGQTVEANIYTNLYFSGGTKTVPTGIVVVGGGTGVAGCPPALAGYTDLDNGYPFWSEVTSTYAGTFAYEGPSGVSQNIFGDTYIDLALDDEGTKLIEDNTTVTVTSITSGANTPLEIYAGTLNTGTGASTLSGTLAMNDANAILNVGSGELTLDNDFDLTLGTLNATGGDETVDFNGATLTLAATGSVLNFADGSTLEIAGTLDNDGDGTNLNFACESFVVYDGGAAQSIAPTISTNAYGNLSLSGGNKVIGAASNYDDDIYVCSDFALDGGNFDLTGAADGNSIEAGGVLFMQDVAGTVTYTANEEVIGSMSRTTDAVARSYTLNNAQTVFSLGASADNPTNLDLYVRPGVNPVGYVAATDVNRKVRFDYGGGTGNEFAFDARVGYLEAEGPGGGAWTAPNDQASVRFYEDGDEKVGTGVPPTRGASSGATLGYVELTGILTSNTVAAATPNDIGQFANTNDFVLRAGPTTFYSVQNGRWTNPNTWDEGTQPAAADDVEIRHAVYVGIDGEFISTPGGADDVPANNTRAEADHYGALEAANDVRIIDADATYTNPALIIGNEDNGSYTFPIAGDITNENAGATAAFPFALTKAAATPGDFQGIWLINNSEVTDGTNVPHISTTNIINTGTVNNEGIIELGN